MAVAQTLYCKRSDLSIFGTTSAALAVVDTTVQDRCISGASARIDGALRSQVNLPLTNWGDDILRAAAIMAAYDCIYGNRGQNPEAGPVDDTDPLVRRYDEVVKWLSDVADGMGTTAVGSPTPVDASTPAGAAQVFSNVSRGWQDSSSGRQGAFTGRRR